MQQMHFPNSLCHIHVLSLLLIVLQWDLSRDKQTLLHVVSKGADQPAHPRSLISALVVRFLESLMIPLLYAKFQCSC